MADRWQLLKDGVPVMVCNSIEEAEDEYCKHDCDEMRRIPGAEDKIPAEEKQYAPDEISDRHIKAAETLEEWKKTIAQTPFFSFEN